MSFNLCAHIFNLCQNASQLSAQVNAFLLSFVGWWEFCLNVATGRVDLAWNE